MIKRLEHLIRYYWLTFVVSAVIVLIFAGVVYKVTESVIPDDQKLLIKITTPVFFNMKILDWQKELETELKLKQVIVDCDSVNTKDIENHSWDRFNVSIYTQEGDLFMIPANKAESLAKMGVLKPLKELFADADLDEKYSFEGEDGTYDTYAISAINANILDERFGIDPSGENGSELVFCVPKYSHNIPAAVQWINLVNK